MRIIKFRAWDKQAGMMFSIFDSAGEDWFLPKWKERYDVMQFTGLKDCKRTEGYPDGQEVYESDLCEKDGKIYQVVWVNDCAKWGLKVIKTPSVLARNMTFPLQQYIYEGTAGTNFEVIGNSFEHPELMGGKG